jgi:hypothetical protein
MTSWEKFVSNIINPQIKIIKNHDMITIIGDNNVFSWVEKEMKKHNNVHQINSISWKFDNECDAEKFISYFNLKW